ncbi:hypothetical protein FRC12_005188 [Ceratobasidium sp. 428]|nr:hypothetical protein FRC12_005188 [Ceratobasidium sp. 428]
MLGTRIAGRRFASSNTGSTPDNDTNISKKTFAHFAAFFARFPFFNYDPSQSFSKQFKTLKKTPQWKENTGRQPINYKLALVLQFNETYGTDQNDTASWQNLCRVLQIEDVPEDITSCKKIVKSTHVNFVDLVEMPNTQRPVKHFKSCVSLSWYSKKKDKIFPRDEAKAGGILKYLLRPIDTVPAKRTPLKK